MTPGPAAADGGYEEVLVFRAPKAAIQTSLCVAAFGALLNYTTCLPRVLPGVIIVSPLRGFLWSLVKFPQKKQLMFPILYRGTFDFAKPEGACPAGLRDCYNYNPRCNRGL